MLKVSSKRFDLTSWVIGCFFVVTIAVAMLSAKKTKNDESFKRIIMDKVPTNVQILDPLSNQLMSSRETVKKDFQVQYASSTSVVGWLSFITDQGQPLSDQIAIGTSMASFSAGQPKTFPVVLHHPTIARDYHMVVVLCDALGVGKARPKVEEVERFMRIGAMGGKLPRRDCSTVHFRL